jgi:hypothetical protein
MPLFRRRAAHVESGREEAASLLPQASAQMIE